MKYRVIRDCYFGGHYYKEGIWVDFPSTTKLPRHFKKPQPPQRTIKKSTKKVK